MLKMIYDITKYFSYANIKLKFTPKTIIKEVKMCTVKVTINYDLRSD